MNTLNTFRNRAAFVLAAASLFICRAAEACPGCKQAVGGDGAGGNHTVSFEAVGYAASIGMLLFMIAAVLTTLGYFAYKNCQAIARAQQAAWEAEEDGMASAGRA